MVRSEPPVDTGFACAAISWLFGGPYRLTGFGALGSGFRHKVSSSCVLVEDRDVSYRRWPYTERPGSPQEPGVFFKELLVLAPSWLAFLVECNVSPLYQNSILGSVGGAILESECRAMVPPTAL